MKKLNGNFSETLNWQPKKYQNIKTGVKKFKTLAVF